MSATATDQPFDGARLARVLGEFRATGAMDVAFGGPVRRDGSGLQITGTCGTHTRSLANLRVTSGNGLGGKSILMARPVSVVDYVAAQGITHTYDAAVREEHLATVVALPVLVERRARMVVYVANRGRVELGDRWYDAYAPLVRRVERDVMVEDEVRRRVASLEEAAPQPRRGDSTLSRTDLREISDEISDVAALITDEGLRRRLEQVSARMGSLPRPPAASGPVGTPAVKLAAREIDVLEQVAMGCSNREAAEALGIVESTVKSYLKHAMRKLHATNRVQAIRRAREAGLIADR